MITISMLFLILQVKHLIVDWCWQPEYEWKNKGTYGHWGGVRHAGKNAIGTGICLAAFFPVSYALLAALADFILHYHIDWAKMNVNQVKGWTPNDPQFWMLTGLDQFAHQVCYIGIVLACFLVQNS